MVPYAEGPVTLLRREHKVLLAPEEAREVAARLGDGRAATTRVATVYFDAPGAPLALRALESPGDCVKVRAKAYRPDRSGRPGRVVLELKRERGGLTTKDRAWLPRAALPAALARLPVPGPLAPLVATSYRRRVWQPCEGWRVTLDDGLRFHPAGWALLDPDAPPWPDRLPPPVGAEPRAILELKLGADAPPRWLAALVAERARPYSKLAEAYARAAPARTRRA